MPKAYDVEGAYERWLQKYFEHATAEVCIDKNSSGDDRMLCSFDCGNCEWNEVDCQC